MLRFYEVCPAYKAQKAKISLWTTDLNKNEEALIAASMTARMRLSFNLTACDVDALYDACSFEGGNEGMRHGATISCGTVCHHLSRNFWEVSKRHNTVSCYYRLYFMMRENATFHLQPYQPSSATITDARADPPMTIVLQPSSGSLLDMRKTCSLFTSSELARMQWAGDVGNYMIKV